MMNQGGKRKRKKRQWKSTPPAVRREACKGVWATIDEADYFDTVESLIEKYPKERFFRFVVYDRESSKTQNRDGNAAARKLQIAQMCRRLFHKAGKKRKCVGYFYETAGGWSDKLRGRKKLAKAIRVAKRHNAVLIAPTVCRFVRVDSLSRDVKAKLRKRDIERLRRVAGEEIILVSLCPLNATFKERTGFLTKLGQAGKNNKGGRPREEQQTPKPPAGYRVEIREQYEGIVLRLCATCSYREIEEIMWKEHGVNISKSTVQRWYTESKNA